VESSIAPNLKPLAAAETTSGTMKAIVAARYGPPDVLELREVDKPVIEDHQVLVRVHASCVNPADWYRVTGPWFARIPGGLRKPKLTKVGTDLAGRVEVVGKDVTEFRPGDEVFGTALGAKHAMPLPGGRTLDLYPFGLSGGSLELLVTITDGSKRLLDTTFRLSNNGTILVGGPAYGDGVLLVAISGSF